MFKIVSAYAVGLLFGLGLTLSQMINPAKVLNFLDIAGAWDPSLAFVMGSALVVTILGYKYVLSAGAPVLEEGFFLPTAHKIDRKLLAGAATFGVGWGLVGLCPGPALTALATGAREVMIFVLTMLGTIYIYRRVNR